MTSTVYETLQKKKNALIDVLQKISEIELPCYATIDAPGYECDEENLCDACKVIQLADHALENDDKSDIS